MNIKRVHPGIIWGSSLAVVFVVSLLCFLFGGGISKSERVLFFPEENTMEISGEKRILPRHWSREKNIEVVIKDQLLGPLSMDYLPIVPRGTKLNSILLRDGVVFMDLSADILFESTEKILTLEEAFSVMERTVLLNFPAVKQVVITIEGEAL